MKSIIISFWKNCYYWTGFTGQSGLEINNITSIKSVIINFICGISLPFIHRVCIEIVYEIVKCLPAYK